MNLRLFKKLCASVFPMDLQDSLIPNTTGGRLREANSWQNVYKKVVKMKVGVQRAN